MSLPDLLAEARRTGDFAPLVGYVPYARFMGFTVALEGDDVVGAMRYADHLVGNPKVGALHGGTIGALMEFAGIFKVIHASETRSVPKTVSITVEYLRSAKQVDTFARARFVRQGRLVSNVRIEAYQDDPTRLVAAANAHFFVEPGAAPK